jgi:aldehyde:ferredoxin oxidoreductase
MTVYGFANKLAHIDLTAGKVEFKPIPEDWARQHALLYEWPSVWH